jgi:hypothetical protein
MLVQADNENTIIINKHNINQKVYTFLKESQFQMSARDLHR